MRKLIKKYNPGGIVEVPPERGFILEGQPQFYGLTGYSGNGLSTTGLADMYGNAYDWGLILPEAVAKNEIFKIGNQRYRVKFNKDNKPYLEDRMGNLIPFDYDNYVQTGWDEVNKVRTFRQKPLQTTSFEVDDADYSGLESLGDFYDWANKTFEGIPYRVVDNGGNSRYVIMPWDSPDDPLTTKYYLNSPISQETLNALKLRAYSENPENRVYITLGKTAEEINAENANRALASMDGLTIGMNADSSPSGLQLNDDMRAAMAGTNANLYYMPFIAGGGAPVNIGFAGLTGYELGHNPYWMQKTADYWNNGLYGQAVLSGLGDAAYGTLGFLPAAADTYKTLKPVAKSYIRGMEADARAMAKELVGDSEVANHYPGLDRWTTHEATVLPESNYPPLYRRLAISSPKDIRMTEDGRFIISSGRTGDGHDGIINFTTDAPARGHSNHKRLGANDTFIFRGEDVFPEGEVMNIEPSDTFILTEGLEVAVNPSDVTVITGNPRMLPEYLKRGFNILSSPDLRDIYTSVPTTLETPQIVKGINLNTTRSSLSANAIEAEMERLAYNRYAPTIEDYARMEEEFGLPSGTIAVNDEIKLAILDRDYETLSNLFSRYSHNMRRYPTFLNVIYDPATDAEAIYRGVKLGERKGKKYFPIDYENKLLELPSAQEQIGLGTVLRPQEELLGIIENPSMDYNTHRIIQEPTVYTPEELETMLTFDKGSGKVIRGEFDDLGWAPNHNKSTINNGILMPGAANEEGATAYTWWNRDQPFTTGVGGRPFDRFYVMNESDVPGILNVKEQPYKIGQWNGKRGFVRKSEMVTPEGVDLSKGTIYVRDPLTGNYRVGTIDDLLQTNTANWYDWATTNQGNVLGEAPIRNYNGDIIGERFGELVSDAGSEKMIYADALDPNYVLKVYDAPFEDMSREFTANPLVNETLAGWVTTPDGKYYRVTRLPRYSNIPSDLTPEQHNALARMLKENGWDPYMANGEVRAAYKDGLVMNDFYQNVAFNEAGNPVLIDNNVIPATEGWNNGLTRWEVPVLNPMERRPINKPENALFTYWAADPELEAFANEFTSPEGEYGQYIKRMSSVPEDDPFGIPSILTENDPTNIVDFLLFGASDEALNRLGVTREQLNRLDPNFYKLGKDLAKYGGPLTSALILLEIPKAARTPEIYSPLLRGSLKLFFEEISWPKLVRNLKESHNIDLELPLHKALRDELWELWSDPMKGVTFENGYVDPRYGGYSLGPHYIRFPFDYSPDRYTLAHELHHSMRNRFKGIMANHGLKPDFPLSENDILASLDPERYKTQIPSEYFTQERNAMRKMAGFSPEDRRVLTPDAEIGATAFETNMNLYDLYYDTYGKYPSLEEFESFIDNMAEEGKLISYTKDISYTPRFNSLSALVDEMDYWGKVASGEIPLDEALALEGEFKNYQLSQNKDPLLAKYETETEIANLQDRNYAKLLKALASTMFATYLYNKSE